MKVKDLVYQLQKLPQDDEIVITAMDDKFYCNDFELHSAYDDGQAQEIILNVYVNSYDKFGENWYGKTLLFI